MMYTRDTITLFLLSLNEVKAMLNPVVKKYMLTVAKNESCTNKRIIAHFLPERLKPFLGSPKTVLSEDIQSERLCAILAARNNMQEDQFIEKNIRRNIPGYDHNKLHSLYSLYLLFAFIKKVYTCNDFYCMYAGLNRLYDYVAPDIEFVNTLIVTMTNLLKYYQTNDIKTCISTISDLYNDYEFETQVISKTIYGLRTLDLSQKIDKINHCIKLFAQLINACDDSSDTDSDDFSDDSSDDSVIILAMIQVIILMIFSFQMVFHLNLMKIPNVMTIPNMMNI